MRRNMTLKLCPLLSLIFSVVGCGKKMEGNSSSADKITPHQETSSRLTLELDTSKGRAYTYRMPQRGSLTQPDRLKIVSGSLSGKSVSIYYNVSATNVNVWDFKCTYIPSSSVPNTLEIDTCYDDTGLAIGDYTQNDVPLEEANQVRIELVGALTNVVVDAFYGVAWK